MADEKALKYIEEIMRACVMRPRMYMREVTPACDMLTHFEGLAIALGAPDPGPIPKGDGCLAWQGKEDEELQAIWEPRLKALFGGGEG